MTQTPLERPLTKRKSLASWSRMTKTNQLRRILTTIGLSQFKSCNLTPSTRSRSKKIHLRKIATNHLQLLTLSHPHLARMKCIWNQRQTKALPPWESKWSGIKLTFDLLILLALKTLWIGSSNAKRGSSRRKNKIAIENRLYSRRRSERVNRSRTLLNWIRTQRNRMMKVASLWLSSWQITKSYLKIRLIKQMKRTKISWKMTIPSLKANQMD